MAKCESELSDPDGCARFWTFLRRFKRNNGDMEKLIEDLTFGVGDEPEAL